MKNCVYVLLILAVLALGCGKSDSGSLTESLGFADETAEASALVNKANEDLREIRKIQKTNLGKLDTLKEAMGDRDAARTRQILDELITAMNDGLALGSTASARIDEATDKKTNEKFNDSKRSKNSLTLLNFVWKPPKRCATNSEPTINRRSKTPKAILRAKRTISKNSGKPPKI